MNAMQISLARGRRLDYSGRQSAVSTSRRFFYRFGVCVCAHPSVTWNTLKEERLLADRLAGRQADDWASFLLLLMGLCAAIRLSWAAAAAAATASGDVEVEMDQSKFNSTHSTHGYKLQAKPFQGIEFRIVIDFRLDLFC